MSTSSEPLEAITYRPDLPDFGAYLRWPCEGEAWIHPEDVDAARRLLPSERVFRRTRWDGTYYWLHYGKCRLRVLPSLWVQVPSIDLEVGQQVELLHQLGRNDAGIYRVAEILYSPEQASIEYILTGDSLRIQRKFTRDDLRPLRVRYSLRSGFYRHEIPKAQIPTDVTLLDVGDLLDPS